MRLGRDDYKARGRGQGEEVSLRAEDAVGHNQHPNERVGKRKYEQARSEQAAKRLNFSGKFQGWAKPGFFGANI